MVKLVVPLIVKFFGVLPRRLAYLCAHCVGALLWLAKGREYRISLKNMRLCFPELNAEEQQVMGRESLIETVKTAVEACAIWRNSWDWLQKRIVAVEGEQLLRAELAKGQGLLVLAPHLGNWEVVAPYLASVGPLTAMYKPFPTPCLDKLIYSGRCKLNISMAPANRKGVCMLLKALQQGGIVGVLPDQMPEEGAGAEPVDFFGHKAMTITLVHSLISRTNARVVLVFAQRVEKGFKVITLPVDERIYSESAEESLLGMNASIERAVRIAPTQYQWEYNRFRKYFPDQESPCV